MSPLIRGFSARRQLRGAIGLMAAVTFALAVLCMLLVIDSGRLYLEKRSLQRVADVAALEAATRAGQCAPTSTAPGYAIIAATRNGFTADGITQTIATDCGTLTTDPNNLRIFSANPAQNQVIRVVVTHSVARSIAAGVAALFPGGLGSLQAIAGKTTVQLQNLLNLQTGTPAAGLNLNMNLSQLVEGEVQLANSQGALGTFMGAGLVSVVWLLLRKRARPHMGQWLTHRYAQLGPGPSNKQPFAPFLLAGFVFFTNWIH